MRSIRSMAFVLGVFLASSAIAAARPRLLAASEPGEPRLDSTPPVLAIVVRAFYLTKEAQSDGSQAAAACAPGFHMASIWEIVDPSNLRYDATLGLTRDDSGFGPPALEYGWARTGHAANADSQAGIANCNAFTTSVPPALGTTIALFARETTLSNTSTVAGWVVNLEDCSLPQRVWCVQDFR